MSASTALEQSASASGDGMVPSGAVLGGRFRIESPLGSGGMGVVYAATDTVIGRRVAVKVLHKIDPKTRLRFEREARAASSVSSRHVVAVHDFGTDEVHGLYMVMEQLVGVSLGDRLEIDTRLSPDEAAHIALQIAEALQAAHDAGVVHRDLKPDNVFLLEEGGLKVLDFGIARLLHDERPHEKREITVTDTGTIIGTPAYISPEGVRRSDVGPASDLYQLGVILFRMLTGHLPFHDPEPVAMAALHLRAPVPPMQDMAPDANIPLELETLTRKLLEKEPSARPFSAEQVAFVLRAATFGDAAPTGRHSTDGRRKQLQRQGGTLVLPRGRSGLVALLVGVALAVGVLAWALWPTADPTPVFQPLPREAAAVEPAREAPAAPDLDVEPIEPATLGDVEIEVDRTPIDAIILWDGVPAESPLLVPADGEIHELEVRAPRHRTHQSQVRTDRDQRISVTLIPIRRRTGMQERQLPGKLREW